MKTPKLRAEALKIDRMLWKLRNRRELLASTLSQVEVQIRGLEEREKGINEMWKLRRRNPENYIEDLL